MADFPVIISLSPVPQRNQNINDFSDKADAFLGKLPTFRDQLNQWAQIANALSLEIKQDVQAAQNAEQGAISARDAAQASGNLYSTVAAGLASGNEFFSVVSAENDKLFDLYQNDGGSAVFINSYAGGPVGGQEITTSTGTQTVAEALDRRGVKFTALRAPTSGEFDPEDYLETSTKVTVGLECYTLSYRAPVYANSVPFDEGGMEYLLVSAGTGIDDGGSFIDLGGSGLQAKGVFAGGIIVESFGTVGDGEADDTPPIHKAIVFGRDNDLPVSLSAKTYGIDGAKGPFPTLDPNHGGGIRLFPGSKLRGKGINKTVLRNIADDWRMVVGNRGGQDVEISGLTIDGGWPALQPVPVETDAKRGECLIFWNPTEPLRNLLIKDIFCKNSGHYGIGLENAEISGSVLNTHFENIGGDCIDIKSTATTGKQLIIDRVFSYDGCGHNDAVYDNQAVVDVGGNTHVTNVFIKGLDSYGSQTGNTGVRFRAKIGGRTGSPGSTGSGFFIESSKLPSEGSLTSKKIVGLAVHDEDITVSGVFADKCYWGIRFYAAADSVPLRCTGTGLHANNCTGADSNAMGIGTDGASIGLNIEGTAESCDNGLDLGGIGSTINVKLLNNDVGIKSSAGTLQQNNITAFINGSITSPGTSDLVREGFNSILTDGSIINALRKPSIDLRSYASGLGDWTGENGVHGELNFYSADVSGAGAGVRASVRARMSGASGAGSFLELSGTDVAGPLNNPAMRISGTKIQCLYPVELKVYSISGLPSASVYARSMVYVSDGAASRPIAISDGTVWRYADGTAV